MRGLVASMYFVNGRDLEGRRLATVAALAGAALRAVSVVLVVVGAAGVMGVMRVVGLMRVTAWWAGALVPTAGARRFAGGAGCSRGCSCGCSRGSVSCRGGVPGVVVWVCFGRVV